MRQSPATGGLPELASPAAGTRTSHSGALAGDDPRTGARNVGTKGSVAVDDEHHYIQQTLAGQQVVLFVHAPDRTCELCLEGGVIKAVASKGLLGREMAWEEDVALMKEQARSEDRRWRDKQHR